VARAQSRLEELGALSVSDLASLEEAIAREWGDALAFAQASPFPSEDTLSSHVYA